MADERKLTADELAQVEHVANFILSLIDTPADVFNSWGASDFLGRMIGTRPALSFKVNGFICQGHVTIVYDEGKGGFDVFTYKPNGYKQAEVEGVQLHELQKVCDRLIETTDADSPEYIAKANAKAAADIKRALDILDEARKAERN